MKSKHLILKKEINHIKVALFSVKFKKLHMECKLLVLQKEKKKEKHAMTSFHDQTHTWATVEWREIHLICSELESVKCIQNGVQII